MAGAVEDVVFVREGSITAPSHLVGRLILLPGPASHGWFCCVWVLSPHVCWCSRGGCGIRLILCVAVVAIAACCTRACHFVFVASPSFILS